MNIDFLLLVDVLYMSLISPTIISHRSTRYGRDRRASRFPQVRHRGLWELIMITLQRTEDAESIEISLAPRCEFVLDSCAMREIISQWLYESQRETTGIRIPTGA